MSTSVFHKLQMNEGGLENDESADASLAVGMEVSMKKRYFYPLLAFIIICFVGSLGCFITMSYSLHNISYVTTPQCTSPPKLMQNGTTCFVECFYDNQYYPASVPCPSNSANKAPPRNSAYMLTKIGNKLVVINQPDITQWFIYGYMSLLAAITGFFAAVFGFRMVLSRGASRVDSFLNSRELELLSKIKYNTDPTVKNV